MPFPSPADDYLEHRLSLDDLIVHPATTFFMRMAGIAMDPTIRAGDVLIVDRALTALDYQVVVVRLKGKFLVRRLITYEDGYMLLLADNPAFVIIEVTDESDCDVWGVVTYAIHKLTAPTKRVRRHR